MGSRLTLGNFSCRAVARHFCFCSSLRVIHIEHQTVLPNGSTAGIYLSLCNYPLPPFLHPSPFITINSRQNTATDATGWSLNGGGGGGALLKLFQMNIRFVWWK